MSGHIFDPSSDAGRRRQDDITAKRNATIHAKKLAQLQQPGAQVPSTPRSQQAGVLPVTPHALGGGRYPLPASPNIFANTPPQSVTSLHSPQVDAGQYQQHPMTPTPPRRPLQLVSNRDIVQYPDFSQGRPPSGTSPSPVSLPPPAVEAAYFNNFFQSMPANQRQMLIASSMSSLSSCVHTQSQLLTSSLPVRRSIVDFTRYSVNTRSGACTDPPLSRDSE